MLKFCSTMTLVLGDKSDLGVMRKRWHAYSESRSRIPSIVPVMRKQRKIHVHFSAISTQCVNCIHVVPFQKVKSIYLEILHISFANSFCQIRELLCEPSNQVLQYLQYYMIARTRLQKWKLPNIYDFFSLKNLHLQI